MLGCGRPHDMWGIMESPGNTPAWWRSLSTCLVALSLLPAKVKISDWVVWSLQQRNCCEGRYIRVGATAS